MNSDPLIVSKLIKQQLDKLKLPIGPLLENSRRKVDEANQLILVAEPGAGKTTTVPLALLDSLESNKKILVAELNDIEIVGIVSIVFLSRLNRTTLEMYIPELVVLEKYRNQGVGKKLIASCIDLAKEKKCHRIRLESGHQRKNSHKFYQNLGFEQSALSFTKNLE